VSGFSQLADVVAADPVLTSNAVRIYWLLVSCDMRRTGEVWPSYEWLTERTGLSESTIRREVRLLADAGYVVIERRGGNRSNLYRLLVVVRSGKVRGLPGDPSPVAGPSTVDPSPTTGPDPSPMTGEADQGKETKKQTKGSASAGDVPQRSGFGSEGGVANVLPLRRAVGS
jgi:DNA-binding transcriptional ArsR family regulator